MDIQALLKREVKKSFNTLGTLAKDITFTRKTVGEFNFADSSTSSVNIATAVIKGVVIDNNRNLSQTTARETIADMSKTTRTLTVVVNSDDIAPLGTFDTLTIDGVVYKPTLSSKNNGYTTEIFVVRGE